MSRVLLVELEPALVQRLTSTLENVGYEVAAGDAVDVIKRLITDGPELCVLNLELTQGSGFSLVNRIRRNEALAGLKLVLVAANASDAAIDAHKRGPTPANAYVRKAETMATSDFADACVEAAKRVLSDHLPEVAYGDLVALDAPSSSSSMSSSSAPGAAGATNAIGAAGGVKPKSFEAVIAEIGSYRVLRRMPDEDGGAVFACRDSELGRDVAIKLMKLEGNDAERDEREKRFQREGRVLALLHSPHIVAVYGAGTKFGIPFLVRELIDGDSLAAQIARDGPLDEKSALLRVRETARGLRHAAQSGVIHRDVRPENVHVVDGHAKIARFSMGRRTDDPRITRGGLRPLDMTYVAPERVRGHEDVRGDIYALGVTLFTLIAGRSPYANASCVDIVTGKLVEQPMALDQARPGVSERAAQLVARMIAEDPGKRPQTYDDVLGALDDALRAIDAESQVPMPAVGEPSAVMGTLRLMSVVEIVQSLELARKTAAVSIPLHDGSEGKLAFVDGKLVHASLGDKLGGDDAFFALVGRNDGSFRVEYESTASLQSLAKNVDTPVTGLLLEAARRADTAARANDPLVNSLSGALDKAFLEASTPQLTPPIAPASSIDTTTTKAARIDDGARDDRAHHDDVAAAFGRRPRTVHPAIGFALIAATTALFVYGGMHTSFVLLGADDGDDESAAKDIAALIAKNHKKAQDAHIALAVLQPKLAALEATQASSASASEAAHKRVTDARDAIENALRADVDAHKASVRTATDGDDGDDVIVELPEATLFASDGDDVSVDGKAVLARCASAIEALGKDVSVRVEGHTDDADPPKKSGHKNNWSFSGTRAASAAKALVQLGLSSSHTKPVAMADSAPLASNRNAKGRARNRRVELHVVLPAMK